MRIMEMNQTKKMRKKKKKLIAYAHSQVSEIEDKIMNFSTQNLKQSSIISYFYKPVSSSQ